MNSITRVISRALTATVLIFIVACSDSGDGVLYTGDLPTAPAASTPAPEPSPGNIVEVASEAGSFPTLLAALEAAGLVDALSDASASLTVFAPTEEAFAALPDGALDALLADPDALANVLTYHVIDSEVGVSAALDLAPTTVETLQGSDVALTVRADDYLYVNMAKVVDYDIEASNGVIHVVDSVLMPLDLTPSALTIAEIASADGNFETLVAAASAADLVGTLGNPDASLTLFAPTDAAFTAMGEAAVQYLLSDSEKLESTLLYHVAGTPLTSVDALAAAGQGITMANGDNAMFSLSESGLMIDGATLTTTDIVASNGIIHVIDTVLQAPSVGPAPIGIVAAANGSFTTLTSAIEAAGLGDTLLDPNANLTVFAPTDEAFAALPAVQLENILADKEILTDLLQYHLYPDTVSASDAAALAGNAIVMANGESATVSVVGDDLLINDATVILADVPASNGVIHAIDKVLAPSGVNLAVAEFSGTFGGATVADDIYTFPAAAESWAGFANDNTTLYPMSFPYGGKLTFTAAIPEGGADTAVYFRFERLPFPNTEPSYNTDNVLVTTSGGTRTYTIEIPDQGDNTFESFLLYVVDRDQPVMIKDVVVESYSAEDFADFKGTFGGATVAENIYTFPATAEVWGGFANDNTTLYPLSFPRGGKITFSAGVPDGGTDNSIRFRFERLPFPDVEPSYNTSEVVISGDEATYTIEIPAQGDNTFESFLLYIVERDSPVIVKNVRVTAYEADDLADFSGTFGGTAVADDVYSFPGAAEGWGGFANDNTSLYPVSFPKGGYIVFEGSIPEGGSDTNVRFRFERLPFPDVDPSFDTEATTVSGNAPALYRIELPELPASNTFSSFLMYLGERDSPVVVKNVRAVAY